jgi:hypothetical protein
MMERWALVSGLRGDLDLYERIQSDLKRQRGTAHLFVLGDMISPDHNCDALLTRLRKPKRGDLQPNCIYGWWEEQLLIHYGYRGDQKPDVRNKPDGATTMQHLREAVSQEHLNWLASLQFGFIELDCGLIHGSSADVGDPLQETTSPLILLDRLTRLDVNRLFTARSGRQFRLQLTGGQIQSKVKDHAGEKQRDQAVPKRSVIGIGSGENYTMYDPASDHIEFLSVAGRSGRLNLGFG